MKSKKKPTDLKSQTTIWYKKLKDSGFVDIEHKSGMVKAGVPNSAHYHDATLRELTLDYYRMAQHFLNNNKFETEQDRVIWTYRTEGLSIREIVKVLNKATRKKTNRIRIWKTVQKLEQEMKDYYLRP